MLRPTTRLAAGALVLALPLAAAAGCGVEKKRTVKAEFASAAENLGKSKAVSFSLGLEDSKGKLAALANKDASSETRSLIDTAFSGRITVTIDPTGATTLADLSSNSECSTNNKPANITAELKKVNLSIAVSDAKATLGEIRLVDGALFARVDLKEIGVIATKGGVEDFDAQVDDGIESAGPKLTQALTDAKNGKWLTLPLAKYTDKLQDLAKSFTGQVDPTLGSSSSSDLSCADTQKLGKNLLSGVRPYVKVTDANDSSSNRVLDVKIKVRPALKAALAVVKSAKGLPFADLLADVQPVDVDDAIADGTAKGTVTLNSGHLKRLTVDIDSIRTLDPEAAKKDDVSGSRVVLDIDDSAGEVKAPTDVSTFDIGSLIDELLNGLMGTSESLGGSLEG